LQFFHSQDGERLFHNVEMGPPKCPLENESRLDIRTAKSGDHLYHCNKYLRLDIEQVTGLMIDSSEGRMTTFDSFKAPKNRADVIEMLGDNSADEHTVFREKDENDFVKTIAVGIFDCSKRTLSLYSDNPKCNEPLVVLPLVIKEK
jgi:hypothetical protein